MASNTREYAAELRQLRKENEGLRSTLEKYQTENDEQARTITSLRSEIHKLKNESSKFRNREILGVRPERYIPAREPEF